MDNTPEANRKRVATHANIEFWLAQEHNANPRCSYNTLGVDTTPMPYTHARNGFGRNIPHDTYFEPLATFNA